MNMRKLILGILFCCLGVAVLAGSAQKPRYRGFTVIDTDFESLRKAKEQWGVNQVRYMITPVWRRAEFPGKSDWEILEILAGRIPELVENARKLDLGVIVDLHTIPEDDTIPAPPKREFASTQERDYFLVDWWWRQPESYQQISRAWKLLSAITANYPEDDIWLELYNEPLNWVELPKGPTPWKEWAQRLTREIREVDTAHPILIASGPGQLWYGFEEFPLIEDPMDNVIYTLHMWQPFLYTHQGVATMAIRDWPGEFSDASGGEWDKERLRRELHQAIEFQRKHGVRLHVGEFGVARYAPGGEAYLRDVLELFEELGWDWNYHAFQEAGVWSLEDNENADIVREANGQRVQEFRPVTEADQDAGYEYLPYLSVPHTAAELAPTEITGRGRLLKSYLERNRLRASDTVLLVTSGADGKISEAATAAVAELPVAAEVVKMAVTMRDGVPAIRYPAPDAVQTVILDVPNAEALKKDLTRLYGEADFVVTQP